MVKFEMASGYHITNMPVRRFIKREIKSRGLVNNKPLGALWVAPAINSEKDVLETGTLWTEWSELEGFGIPSNGIGHVYKMTANKVLIIESYGDIIDFMTKFPDAVIYDNKYRFECGIDYHKLSMMCDGIYLINAKSMRYNFDGIKYRGYHLADFNAWDIDSGAFWNLSKTIYVGEYHYKKSSYGDDFD